MTDVLTTRRDRGQARHGLDELWTRAESRGWFAGAAPRVVIQVDAAGDPRLVGDTVHGLAAFLRARLGIGRVEVLDPARGDWAPLRTLALAPADTVVVAGIAQARVVLPRLWCEPLFLITVTAVRTDPQGRLRGILATQADALRTVGGPASRAARVFEAHRLAGSDLAVACGAAEGRAWWVASPSDVAVDRVVAQAAGIEPARLPDLRAIARHELMPAATLVEELPGLRGLAGPAWRAALADARGRMAAAGRFAVADARAVRRNIGKVPHALRRRLPALLRRKGRAA